MKSELKFIDLFAGIGGTRLGFESACKARNIETKCMLSSEIDKNASYTYEINFHEIPQGDVRRLNNLPDYEFLLGGFPCQPFSYAGNKNGFGDTRGTLFFEIERILSEAKNKPKGFLLENVRGLHSHDGGRTFKTITNRLQSLGYGVKYLLINSCHFGVPQNRVRLYIIGLLDKEPMLTLQSDLGAPDSHKFKDRVSQRSLFDANDKPGHCYVKDIIENKVDNKYACSKEFIDMLKKVVGSDFGKLNGVRLIDYRGGSSIHSWELGLKGDCSESEIQFMNLLITNRRKKIYGDQQDGKKLTIDQIRTFYKKNDLSKLINSLCEKGYLKEMGGKYNPVCGNMSFEIFKFLDPDSISITLTASDSHKLGYVQNNKPRHITPRECARLQGFPDDFKCHPIDSYAYTQFGNSVTVPVIEKVILDVLDNNRLI